ncbi:hypothetical protein [Sphingomonas kyungheensis]|uniref:Uncharacterized protein n=1 Tax=Sphingomonas kyungheensis TaxID=1069987 RepID=A0ABU8H2N0_9SPHN
MSNPEIQSAASAQDAAPVTASVMSADQHTELAGLIEQASNPNLSPLGRAPILARIEALHAGAALDPAAAAQAAQEATAAEFAPTSAAAYSFEQHVPPGLEIADPDGLGALKGDLLSAGVPSELANGAFSDIAQLHATGAFESDASYMEAGRQCRAMIERSHGPAAKQMIADGLAYLEATAARFPNLEDAITAAMVSPMALLAAAQMKQLGMGSRK